MSFSAPLFKRVRAKTASWKTWLRLFQLTKQVSGKARPQAKVKPVAFFNASTRLTGISLNAAFAYLSASSLQLAGVPVVYFASKAGMSRCVQGTDRNNVLQKPPCEDCTAVSRRLFGNAPVVWFTHMRDEALAGVLEPLSLDELSRFTYTAPAESPLAQLGEIPYGKLVLPALRWVLRMHHLQDDEPTRFLFREYILSAYHLGREFVLFLEKVDPQTVVLFNGIMYPEATARYVAETLGYRVVTHEVGFTPFSGFFTEGDATAYPIDIPSDFVLDERQNQRLDAYLEKRFQGKFTMAGITFWPEMHGLDAALQEKIKGFRQVVPVFTNVVYDTSQVHANTVFPHMFAWLDSILDLIRRHPDTLFILRAHPDEMRPGTRKQSRESVQAWVKRHAVDALPNVVFVDSQEYLSSYELIQRAKFVIVYNSSIGLEAALMGAAVLCGGKARYTQVPMVFFPASPEAYVQAAQEFLAAPEALRAPPEFVENARKFLYYQLFRASLPFDSFLESHPRAGFVQFKSFAWDQLKPEYSPVLKTVVDGILHHKPFLLPEGQQTDAG